MVDYSDLREGYLQAVESKGRLVEKVGGEKNVEYRQMQGLRVCQYAREPEGGMCGSVEKKLQCALASPGSVWPGCTPSKYSEVRQW